MQIAAMDVSATKKHRKSKQNKTAKAEVVFKSKRKADMAQGNYFEEQCRRRKRTKCNSRKLCKQRNTCLTSNSYQRPGEGVRRLVERLVEEKLGRRLGACGPKGQE